MIKIRLWLTVGLVSLALVGCASKEQAVGVVPELLWQASAKVAISHLPDSPEETKRAVVVWRRSVGMIDEVLVRGPLGSTVGKLSMSPEETVLQWRGETYQSADAGELVERLLGVALPIDAFGYWLMGEYHPGFSVVERLSGSNGRVKQLEQLGWRVDYCGYDDEGRPVCIRAVSRWAVVELNIYQWQIP